MEGYRSATIDSVCNGFVIKIGCLILVAEGPKNLKKLICEYLDNPSATEKKYLTMVNANPVGQAPERASNQIASISAREAEHIPDGLLRRR